MPLDDDYRWPTALRVALFPVTYLFLVVFAWYGAYNTLCELRDAPIVGTAFDCSATSSSRLVIFSRTSRCRSASTTAASR